MGVGGISVWQRLMVLTIVIFLFGTKRLKVMGSDVGAVLKNFKQSLYAESETESHTLKN
jgi:sec-independent protein translocase protein TatA